ncbi:MAG: hypothetical protein O2894_13560, partial [Planctomycetota bacterium]|nr:hypothetical protein [Planctomycetota bacterium]
KDEPAKVDPEKDEPAKVDPKKDDPPARSPAECCDDGAKLMTAGRWAEARALYLRAAQDTKLTDDTQVRALRGAAQAWIAEANRQARTGHIDEALATYAAAGKWLDERHSAYERVERAVETARLQLGFSRLHEAETQTERARWLRVQGKAAEAAKVLKAAEINFDFALQQLQRDGVRYWEFLIRRSSMHELLGNSQAMIDDVAHTTKTNNTEVPPHMWVAHATAARRLAQAYAARGDGAQALTWAKAASKVAEDGVGWQDANLTRQQWLDLVHPLFVQATVIGTEDPTALHGKARYWIEEAAKASPAAWEHAEVTRGRMLTAAAMERYIHGLVQRRANKAAAAQVFADAEAKATEAIKAREAAAAAGGLRIDPLSFEVLAAILTVQGKTAEAQAALAKAKSTATQNPD